MRGGIGSRTLAVVVACAALAAVAPSAASAAACTDEFTGPSGGSWTLEANWSHGVPIYNEGACWAADKTVVVSEGNQVAATVSGGSLEVTSGGRLVLDEYAGSSLSGTLEVKGEGEMVVVWGLACAGATANNATIRADGPLACPVTLGAGGRLTGNGTIASSVINDAGVIAPDTTSSERHPGLTITGSYTQGQRGTLELAGNSSSAFPGLHVGGTADLAGTLSILVESGGTLRAVEATGGVKGRFEELTGRTSGIEPWGMQYSGTLAQATVFAGGFVTPHISGLAAEGATLHCAVEPTPGGVVSLQWLRGSTPITGAVESSYVLGPGDVGQPISCAAKVTEEVLVLDAPQSRTETFTSAPTQLVAGVHTTALPCTSETPALLNARPAGSDVLLFGAAPLAYSGHAVNVYLSRDRGSHWQQLAVQARVSAQGYFELRVRRPRSGLSRLRYEVAVGDKRSLPFAPFGALRVIGLHDLGTGIQLRLRHGAGQEGTLTVELSRSCASAQPVVSLSLGAHGAIDLMLPNAEGSLAVYRLQLHTGHGTSAQTFVVQAPH